MADIAAGVPDQPAPAAHIASAPWATYHATADPDTAVLSAVAPLTTGSPTTSSPTTGSQTTGSQTTGSQTTDSQTTSSTTTDSTTTDSTTTDSQTTDQEAADPVTMDTETVVPGTTAADETSAPGASQSFTDRAAEAVDASVNAVPPDNATPHASRGRTTVADEVVEKVAGIAAREVAGVYDLGGDIARAVTTVRERIHLGQESAAQGVSVKMENKTAEVDVVVVIEFGFQVYAVAEAVREKVISSVEEMLGLTVTAVNVRMDDVHIPDHGSADAEHGSAKV